MAEDPRLPAERSAHVSGQPEPAEDALLPPGGDDQREEDILAETQSLSLFFIVLALA